MLPTRPDTTPDVRRLGGDSYGNSRKVSGIDVTLSLSDGYAKTRRPSDYDPMEPPPSQQPIWPVRLAIYSTISVVIVYNTIFNNAPWSPPDLYE